MKQIIAVIAIALSSLSFANEPIGSERVYVYNPYYPQKTHEINELLKTGEWRVKSSSLTSGRADHFVVIVIEKMHVVSVKIPIE